MHAAVAQTSCTPCFWQLRPKHKVAKASFEALLCDAAERVSFHEDTRVRSLLDAISSTLTWELEPDAYFQN